MSHNALVLYWSKSGNTEKVALTIGSTLSDAELAVDIRSIDDSLCVDYLAYDLVFVGSPVYSFLPAPTVTAFLRRTGQAGGHVRSAAPERPGHAAVVFCTYGGGHTGVREAIPALKYMGQFLEHDGIRVVEEWAIVGEFRGAGEEYNLRGRLGDITGRPSEHDLAELRGKTRGLLRQLGMDPDGPARL